MKSSASRKNLTTSMGANRKRSYPWACFVVSSHCKLGTETECSKIWMAQVSCTNCHRCGANITAEHQDVVRWMISGPKVPIVSSQLGGHGLSRQTPAIGGWSKVYLCLNHSVQNGALPLCLSSFIIPIKALAVSCPALEIVFESDSLFRDSGRDYK